MLNSLALTDAFLCLMTVWLASRSALAVGYRMAFTLLAIPALLGFLRFSGIYPLETWHPLFTLMSASAALPLLAICVVGPQSIVATRRQFAIIFLGVAMLLGLLIAGLGKFRIYDQALGLGSMLFILVTLLKSGQHARALGQGVSMKQRKIDRTIKLLRDAGVTAVAEPVGGDVSTTTRAVAPWSRISLRNSRSLAWIPDRKSVV